MGAALLSAERDLSSPPHVAFVWQAGCPDSVCAEPVHWSMVTHVEKFVIAPGKSKFMQLIPGGQSAAIEQRPPL